MKQDPTTMAEIVRPPAAPVLACSRLTARYGRIWVCNGVDLSVEAGELLVILGPNGAGKSSLLGSIAGLVNGDGSVLLAARELSGLSAHRRAAAGLALVPEARGNVFPALSVEENVQIGLRLLMPDERLEMRSSIFELFPILRERLSTAAMMLSGGEQQMLAIAMAVARRPKALLLDEPSQGLAPTILDVVAETLGRLKQAGLAMIVAEQNVPFAARIADRFVVLFEGRVVLRGEAAELERQDAILAGFFGGSDSDADMDTKMSQATDPRRAGSKA